MRVLPALALLLLAPLAAALPVAPPEAEIAVEVVGVTDAGTVALNLTAADEDARVKLVVTHEDPLLGTVVDAVLEVNVTANVSSKLELANLRPEVNLSLHLVDVDVVLPTLPDLRDVVNGTRLGELLKEVPALPSVKLPRLAPLLTDFATEGHAWHVGWGNDRGQLLTTTRGHVVASWLFVELDDEGECCVRSVLARVSPDGGRTYGPVHRIATDQADRGIIYSWRAYENEAGDAVFVVSYTRDGGGPTVLVPLDPRRDTIGRARVVDLDGYTFPEVEVVPVRGEVLLASSGWRTGTADARPQVVTVLRLVDDRTVEVVAELDPGTPVPPVGSSPTRMAASPLGVVAVVGVHQASDRNSVPWVATSPDGGATWAQPRNLTRMMAQIHDWRAPTEGGRYAPTPRDLVVDAAGVVHVTFEGNLRGDADGHVRSWYVRIPPVGPETVTELAPMLPEEIAPESGVVVAPNLATRDGRVWLFFTNGYDGAGTPRTYGVESVTGGARFGTPYQLRIDNRTDFNLKDLALMPDGRPVVLGDSFNDLATVPLFDPRFTASRAVVGGVRLSPGAPDRPPADFGRGPVGEGAPAGGGVDGDDGSVDAGALRLAVEPETLDLSPGRAASLRATVRAGSEGLQGARLLVADLGGVSVPDVAPLHVRPGERDERTISLDVGAAPSAGARPRVLLVAADGGVLAEAAFTVRVAGAPDAPGEDAPPPGRLGGSPEILREAPAGAVAASVAAGAAVAVVVGSFRRHRAR